MWDLILSVPDHCLFFLLYRLKTASGQRHQSVEEQRMEVTSINGLAITAGTGLPVYKIWQNVINPTGIRKY